MPIRPGCGGFGIRNFLTLFLSIEVSKAMTELEEAQTKNNTKAIDVATKKIRVLSDQLDESNPVLTVISDAMTAEGDALLALDSTTTSTEEKTKLQTVVDENRAKKEAANGRLYDISERYKNMMKALRTESEKAVLSMY